MIVLKLVTEESELVDIYELNLLNKRCNLSDSEALDQGFLTAEYSLDFLKFMHNIRYRRYYIVCI